MNRKALFWPLAAMLLTACEEGAGIEITALIHQKEKETTSQGLPVRSFLLRD